jgi:hypothetical protein
VSLGPFVFPCNVLCILRNHIFQVEIWLNFAMKKISVYLVWKVTVTDSGSG